jgi:hypothetical protein
VDENLAMLGSLCLGLALVVGFFMFSSNIGALSAFGRYPMSWRKLGLLLLAAFVPAIGTFSAMYACTLTIARANPAALAAGMAAVGWMCMRLYAQLEKWALADAGTLAERLGSPRTRREDQD